MEQVLCYQRTDLEHLFGAPLPVGSLGADAPQIEDVLALSPLFVPRDRAEEDASLKQLIPYQLFCCDRRLLVYRRGGAVGEGRLAGRLSLGVGGHINVDDTPDGRTFAMEEYRQALLRERREEMEIFPYDPGRFAGWINDDSNPVGRVHLGAVHVVEVADPQFAAIMEGGEDIHQEGWWDAQQLDKNARGFETWSRLALSLVE